MRSSTTGNCPLISETFGLNRILKKSFSWFDKPVLSEVEGPVLSKAEGLTTSMRGGVEQFLSGSAMGKRCSAAKRPEDYLEGEVCSFLQPEVLKEVAWLVTNLAHLLDPSIIIFGGSAGMALKSHLKEIEAELKKWMLPETPLPKLAAGQLKDAAMRGAAILVRK